MEVFIGRQPIFDFQEQIVAYELLYRSKKNKNEFPLVDPDIATVDVIINAFLSVGFEELTKGKPSFINFTENILMSSLVDHLDPTSVVIEILEDIPITMNLIERIKELKVKGFKIALDDFVLDDHVPYYNELFTYTDYIKVDFLMSSVAERMEIEKRVFTSFPHIKLLAEKVETREQYEVAKRSGYVLFQGYFFEKPQVVISRDIPANILQYFQIISLLKDEEPNMVSLVENIERDISLTYKLLQLINNSSKRTRFKVRSIKQAIILLGITELRKWIYLLAMREIERSPDSDVFNELMSSSLFRAKVCEKLAKLKYKQNFSEYFLVGMFSLIDSILQRPMNTILSQLPLSEEISETISGGDTEMAPFLQLSIALGKLDWTRIEELALMFNLEIEHIMTIYNEAAEWAENTFK